MPTYINNDPRNNSKYPEWDNRKDHGGDSAVRYMGGKRQSVRDGVVYYGARVSQSGGGSAKRRVKTP